MKKLDYIQYLGLLFDNRLKFKDHVLFVNNLVRKLFFKFKNKLQLLEMIGTWYFVLKNTTTNGSVNKVNLLRNMYSIDYYADSSQYFEFISYE